MMKLYKVIHGTSENIEDFEVAVSIALEEGYELASRLTTKIVTDSNGNNKALFFQPMIVEDLLDQIYYEDDEDDED